MASTLATAPCPVAPGSDSGATAIALHWGHLNVDDAEVARLATCLAADELEHAARFRFGRDRRRFVVRRGKLRETLAATCGDRPATIRFSIGPFGKPQLAPGLPFFSTSHSGDIWAVALGDIELGVDIERIDPAIDAIGIAATLFAPAEHAALAALSGPAVVDAFFACWTRKEAYVKAIGQGLSHPLTAFAVSLGAEPAFLNGGAGWRLLSPRLAPDLAVAIAVADHGGTAELTVHRH